MTFNLVSHGQFQVRLSKIFIVVYFIKHVVLLSMQHAYAILLKYIGFESVYSCLFSDTWIFHQRSAEVVCRYAGY